MSQALLVVALAHLTNKCLQHCEFFTANGNNGPRFGEVRLPCQQDTDPDLTTLTLYTNECRIDHSNND